MNNFKSTFFTNAVNLVIFVLFITTDQSVDSSELFEAFNAKCLKSHDTHRAKHKDTNPVKINHKLVKSADKCAKFLAETNTFRHSPHAGLLYGENQWLALVSSKAGTKQIYNRLTCNEVIASWHREQRYYDYKPPKGWHPKNIEQVGHFTQLVWRGSKEIGCAKSMNETNRKVYLVCHYLPVGNI
ncbi:unnamed protein product, partial [Oppiella nova]